MFVTKKQLSKEVARLERDLEWQKSKFDELRHEFCAVLRHLNLETYKPSSGIKVREIKRNPVESSPGM